MNTEDAYGFFESLLPNNKNWYTAKEVAAILGKSDQYVRDCFDNQKILGHAFNGKAKKGKEKRHSYQVSRQGLLLFLMETANYSPSDFIHHIKLLLEDCPKEHVLNMVTQLKERF